MELWELQNLKLSMIWIELFASWMTQSSAIPSIGLSFAFLKIVEVVVGVEVVVVDLVIEAEAWNVVVVKVSVLPEEEVVLIVGLVVPADLFLAVRHLAAALCHRGARHHQDVLHHRGGLLLVKGPCPVDAQYRGIDLYPEDALCHGTDLDLVEGHLHHLGISQ